MSASADELMAPVPDDRPMLFDLLKLREGEAFSVIKYYEAALTGFLLLTGGLLKFAFDQNATPQLKRVLEVMGIAMALLGLVAAASAEHHRRSLKKNIAQLMDRLCLGLPSDELSVQRHSIIICCLMFLAAIVGWLVLLATKL